MLTISKKGYLLIEAEHDGDYIPDNGLYTWQFESIQELGARIKESIRIFLERNCLLNPHSGELQITDFYWDDPNRVEEPRSVQSLEAFMEKITEIITSIEQDFSASNGAVNINTKFQNLFKVYTDDDTFIELIWLRTNLRIQYNMAPNENKWSHSSFKIIRLS